MNRNPWMAPGEPKCEAKACRAGPCARRDISADGRPLADFSIATTFYGPACMAPGWVKRILPSEAVKPADKPQIKEWIGQ